MSDQLPNRIFEEVSQTFRPTSEGAEKWLYRPIQCLDHGFVYLADYMGTDLAVVDAARVSYGQGTKSVNTAENLIRYLRRHVHTSPSEMVEVKFHCKMPIFVARQWVRHRTANINEYSGRYSEMVDQFYLPEPDVIKKQAIDNKQGRGEDLSDEEKESFRNFTASVTKRVIEFDDYRGVYLPLMSLLTNWHNPVLLNGAVFSSLRVPSRSELEKQQKDNHSWSICVFPLKGYIKSYHRSDSLQKTHSILL